MASAGSGGTAAALQGVFTSAGREPARPIHLVRAGTTPAEITGLAPTQRRWLEDCASDPGSARKQTLIPAPDGSLSGLVLGIGNGNSGDPCGPSELLLGQVASSAPPGTYALAEGDHDPTLAATAWGLGAYRFRRYKTQPARNGETRLVLPDAADARAVTDIVEGVWLGRDLINTPASDLGPAELEVASRALADRHGAMCSVIVGEELLARNFPMIHAVGRASVRAPRLIDITWQRPGGRADAPRVTLVGKGICFDTGGLDIKPASNMLLMKKDMGGAATALALAHMVMAQGLDVRLRVLIPAAENSIDGNAFRPSDVIMSRAGQSVEVGNTDAEGRLVLADALSLADEEKPDLLLSLATLTGACRVALGPDLPGLFTSDDALASELIAAGLAVGDPMWRLPLWTGYDRNLDSEVADLNNVSDGPFAGAITAALFLRRFVRNAASFAHIDLFGWRPSARPLGPKGGEPQTARAIFRVLNGWHGV
ncbi:MAG: leucyl aminopeptidase family protein [Hyphomicrobiaceae bacterium]|nr:leucyl aminopeptidase family protein [Hyphomicrobiaceae bacterium]MCC0007313.1 leucyl aminopeptidase family protein [Hyphomicrobiaceae bacterium]